MNKITEIVSKTMHLGNSEQPTEETDSEKQPMEQPKPENSAPAKTSQKPPESEKPLSEQPAQESPQPEPSKPEAPKQEEPHPEQPTESQIQKPKPPEGQPLPPNERVNAAYKLIYGENAEIPIRHELIATPEEADWYIRSYIGGLFAEPNDNPLTQKFSNLDELLTWFGKTYPLE